MNTTNTMDWCFTKPDPEVIISPYLCKNRVPLSDTPREVFHSGLISYGDMIAPGAYRLHSCFSHAINYLQGDDLVSLVDPFVGSGPLNIVVETLSRTANQLIVDDAFVILDGSRLERIPAICFDSSLPQFSHSQLQILKANLPSFKRLLIDLAPQKSIVYMLDEREGLGAGTTFESELKNRFIQSTRLMQEGRILEAVRTVKGLGFGLTPSGDDFIAGLLLALNFQKATDCRKLIDHIFAAAHTENSLSQAWLRCAKEGRVFAAVKHMILALGQADMSELLLSIDRLLTVGSTSGADMAVGFIFGIEKAIV